MLDDIFLFPSTSKRNNEKVWSKGDLCRVKWSEDGEIYNGQIKQLKRCEGSNKTLAVISFDGFSKEDDTEFETQELLEREQLTSPAQNKKGQLRKENSGLFSPLCGGEDANRLENLYGFYDDNNDEETESTRCSEQQEKTTPQTRKMVAVVSGGEVRSNTRKGVKRSTIGSTPGRETGMKSTKPNVARCQSTLDIELEGSHYKDDDMEKPKFSFPSPGAKVPFILSHDGDEQNIVQVPASINQYLRDYQRDGIRFLYNHYQLKQGAILGDDMGLGKTVQVIGFLAAILNKKGNNDDIMKQKLSFIKKMSDTNYTEPERSTSPFLIIGPGSVIYNWLDELDTWGYFTTSKYHGTDKEYCLTEVKKGKLEIVITSFETFRDNLNDICSVDWQAVIVDEVHRIKDVKSLTTQALRKIPTQLRYGLTGTALQNNMVELWSILDWAQPGILGSVYEFTEEFVRPIEKGQRNDVTKRELAEARKNIPGHTSSCCYKIIGKVFKKKQISGSEKEKFREIRKKIMLRRMKTLIADQLPEKDDNVVFCKLSHLQTSVYKAILNHPDLLLVLKMEDPCSCGSDKSRAKCCFKINRDGINIQSIRFSFMHLLMKVANHVALLIPREGTSYLQKTRSNEICEIALKDHQEFINLTKDATFRTLSDPRYCGKMKVLQGLLQVFEKTHSKVLIFSLSTKLLDILEQYLISSSYEFRRLDGSVSNKRRMELVREFNKNPNIFIFLISTKAGGLGLNLTGANRVVIFDPNWNPSHDLQAQDRAYRIGQRQDVQVYRLISAGTIEENVYLRQIYKQQLGNVVVSSENAKRLFHGVQGNRFRQGELFGVQNMFQLRTGESCLTMDILERNAQVEAGLKGFDMTKYIPSMYETDNSTPDIDNINNKTVDSSTDSDSLIDLFLSGIEDKEESHEQKLNRKASVNKSKSSADRSKYDRNKPGPSKPYEKQRKTQPRSKLRKRSSNIDEPVTESFSSVGDVLGQCGVLHVHKNVKVIGASRAEDHMTRCALQEVYELHQNSQIPAIQCDPLSESSSDEEILPSKKKGGRKPGETKVHNTPKIIKHESTRILIGQTPSAIRHKEFEKLAEFKEKELIKLAEEIVEMNSEDRLELLKAFYIKLHPQLANIINSSLAIIPIDTQLTVSAKKEKLIKTPISKTTRRKEAKGVSFLNQSFSDSESPSSINLRKRQNSTESTESSLEVGRKPSPLAKRRELQGKLMNLRCNNRSRKTIDASCTRSLYLRSESIKGSTATEESTNMIGPTEESTNMIGPTKESTNMIGSTEESTNMIGPTEESTNMIGPIEESTNMIGPTEESTNMIGPTEESTNMIGPTEISSCIIRPRWLGDEGIMYDNMVVIPKGNFSKMSHKISVNLNCEVSSRSNIGENTQNLLNEMIENVEAVREAKYESVKSVQMTNVSNQNAEKISGAVDKSICMKIVKNGNIQSKSDESNYKSILDDFFTEDQVSSKISNKKSPVKSTTSAKLIRKKRSTDDLFVDWDDLTSCSESTASSQIDNKSDLLDHSTLQDEEVDCFSDSKKWKKRSRVKLSVSKTVDKLLQQSDDDYEQLFRRGKMKKKKSSVQSSPLFDHEDTSENFSASLFS